MPLPPAPLQSHWVCVCTSDSPLVELGADLHRDGFHNVTNIDFSSVVVQQMTERHRAFREMECAWRVGAGAVAGRLHQPQLVPLADSCVDARQLKSLGQENVDLVIDKGVLECAACAVPRYLRQRVCPRSDAGLCPVR